MLAVVAAVVALVIVPACTVVDPPALTVGDWTLSRKDFLATMQSLSAAGVFDGRGAAKPAGGTTTLPTDYKTSDTAAVLNIYAQHQIVQQDLVRRNITVTPGDKEAFLQSMVKRAAAQGQQTTVAELEAQLEGLNTAVRMQVDTQIAQQALGSALVPDAEAEAKARADYDSNSEKLAQICLSAVLAAAEPTDTTASVPRSSAPTQADLDSARGRSAASKAKIDGGASFEDVAKSDSDDKASGAQGGKAGCLSGEDLASLPPALAQIVNNQPLNQVSEPTLLEGRGYALFKVTSRETPTFDKVQDQLVAQAREELATTRIDAAVKDAQRRVPVTVDPLFGKWDTTTFEVVPPPGAEMPSTTLPSPETALFPGVPGAGATPQVRTAPNDEPPSTRTPGASGTTGTAPATTVSTSAANPNTTAATGATGAASTTPR